MNIIGKNIRLSLFGESHGTAIGIVIDGLKSGIKIDWDNIREYMSRRKSDGKLGTKRIEPDEPEILSGIYNGFTTGAPITMIIKNKDAQSHNYSDKIVTPRPSHADYPAHIKFHGFADMRGGGLFSGRLTAPIVFAGAICMQILNCYNISIGAHIKSIKNIEDKAFDYTNIEPELLNSLKREKMPLIDGAIRDSIEKEIIKVSKKGDSVGGVIECAIIGARAGLGDIFFGSVESRLSNMIFSIPAIKGIEFGLGFDITKQFGSQTNDQYYYDGDIVKTKMNNNGGILGGLTNGMPIVFSCAIKPTPSIYLEQDTVNLESKTQDKIVIEGRHDPCIALRIIPVIESVAGIVILDLLMDRL